MKIIKLSAFIEVFENNKNKVEEALKELEAKGFINSSGNITTEKAIQRTQGLITEYFYVDVTAPTKFIQFGLVNEFHDIQRTLIIREDGQITLIKDN